MPGSPRVVRRRHRLVEGLKRQPVPEPGPDAEVLDGDVTLLDPDRRRVVAIQRTLPPETAAWPALREHLEVAPWTDTSRSPRGGSRLSGIVAPTVTFGWVPPQPLRRRYAISTSKLTRDDPWLAQALVQLGEACWPAIATGLPMAAVAHEQAVRSIAPAWRLGQGHWTSGVINRSNALPYHRDSGNLAGCLSAMVCLRRNATGGHLHLPEYGVWLGIGDRTLTVFMGSAVWHGVSPITLGRGGRRYTVVWYVRRGLLVGAPTAEAEARRAQLAATTHDQAPA